jgi:hypothetical protein
MGSAVRVAEEALESGASVGEVQRRRRRRRKAHQRREGEGSDSYQRRRRTWSASQTMEPARIAALPCPTVEQVSVGASTGQGGGFGASEGPGGTLDEGASVDAMAAGERASVLWSVQGASGFRAAPGHRERDSARARLVVKAGTRRGIWRLDQEGETSHLIEQEPRLCRGIERDTIGVTCGEDRDDAQYLTVK